MHKKMSACRRSAFLAALRATGNQTIAAERACVSRSWVSQQRMGNPDFLRESDAAIAEAKARLGAHPARRPPSGWGHLDGVELVVKGSNGRRVQIARARVGQITPAVEDRFLAVLAATCNVKAAYTEAGVSKGAIYTHRKRWRAFAEKWDAAIDEGYARIEIGLVENACNLFSAPELPPELPLPPMSVEQAIHVLHMHKYQVRQLGKRPGLRARPPTLEEVAPSIIRKVEAIKRARGLSEAEMEEAKRDWALRRPSTSSG
jgi:hypothetical protein